MPEYTLHCFAQSGNAYRVALMLNLIGADWKPAFVDFFGKGLPRTPEWRAEVNEMGEVPVLDHKGKRLTQSGVILTYLSDLTGKFKPQGEDERLEALRWIIFDNQKLNGYLGPYRFLRNFAKPAGDPAAMAFLKARIDNSLGILEQAARALALPARRPSDHRRHFAGRLPLLPGGGIRLRHCRHPPQYRGLARPHEGAAGLGASLQADAGISAGGVEHDAEKCEAVFGRHHALNY